MDESVIAAMQRWPDVPAVSGWLSLTARGEWRLHPLGDAKPGDAGEAITNPQILAFIARNYTAEPGGRWYFQNGPQRVYVTLALAPWIFRLNDHATGLVTHTDQAVQKVLGWWLTADGLLYVQTELGPGAILDRDLAPVLTQLQDEQGHALEDALLAADSADPASALANWEQRILVWAQGPSGYRGPLHVEANTNLETTLGFVRDPVASQP